MVTRLDKICLMAPLNKMGVEKWLILQMRFWLIFVISDLHIYGIPACWNMPLRLIIQLAAFVVIIRRSLKAGPVRLMLSRIIMI